jgi:hypothetical protein
LDSRNGKKIRLWDDPILECIPLSIREEFEPLKQWMQNQGINNLFEFSTWEASTGSGNDGK